MILTCGTILPGIGIGDIKLGISKSQLLTYIGADCKECSFSPNIKIENAIFSFRDNKLSQICVTNGFEDAFKSVTIGSTMRDVQEKLGDWIKIGDSCPVWQPCNFPGICFELGDYGDETDEWDEMLAPIEWICVYLVT